MTTTSPDSEHVSRRRWWLTLTPEQKRETIAKASPTDLEVLHFDWWLRARDKQLPPDGDWDTWLILAGRGFGKTRTGSELVLRWAEDHPGVRIALVGRIAADVRDTMVEGESGILTCSPPWFMPRYQASIRRLTWPNGSMATTYSADEPDLLRGPQHHFAWADELAAWQYPDAWDQLRFGLRLGDHPRVIVTTTPRPTKIIRELMAAPTTTVTRGSTYENRANLAKAFLTQIVAKYEGTRLGRQELMAEVLDDIEGALWQRAAIDSLRVRNAHEMVRVVVGIDPAVTSGDDADETGIVVVGKGVDGQGYVLHDATCRVSPDAWARRAVDLYHRFNADRIIAEVNQGGDLVEQVIRTVDANVPFKAVRATKGKQTRAEPIAALYEQGRMHHVGSLPHLEDQMCLYTPDGYDGSPDRVDALVWACTELMLAAPLYVGLAGERKQEAKPVGMTVADVYKSWGL